MDDVSEPVPPPTADATERVPPPNSEAVKDEGSVPPQAFGGGPIELSPLHLYPDHTTRHIWDGEVTLAGFIVFNLCLLIYYKIMTLIYFSTRL